MIARPDTCRAAMFSGRGSGELHVFTQTPHTKVLCYIIKQFSEISGRIVWRCVVVF